jgi:hypothetical protein
MYLCKARIYFKQAIVDAQEMKGSPLNAAEKINIRLRVVMETLLEVLDRVDNLEQNIQSRREKATS